jgi:hypothetical protein
VQDRDRGLRLLADVQEAEGVGAEGVDHGVQVDPADALDRADHEGVGREQLTRPLALDMALAEAGLTFFRNAACSGLSSIARHAVLGAAGVGDAVSREGRRARIQF